MAALNLNVQYVNDYKLIYQKYISTGHSAGGTMDQELYRLNPNNNHTHVQFNPGRGVVNSYQGGRNQPQIIRAMGDIVPLMLDPREHQKNLKAQGNILHAHYLNQFTQTTDILKLKPQYQEVVRRMTQETQQKFDELVKQGRWSPQDLYNYAQDVKRQIQIQLAKLPAMDRNIKDNLQVGLNMVVEDQIDSVKKNQREKYHGKEEIDMTMEQAMIDTKDFIIPFMKPKHHFAVHVLGGMLRMAFNEGEESLDFKALVTSLLPKKFQKLINKYTNIHDIPANLLSGNQFGVMQNLVQLLPLPQEAKMVMSLATSLLKLKTLFAGPITPFSMLSIALCIAGMIMTLAALLKCFKCNGNNNSSGSDDLDELANNVYDFVDSAHKNANSKGQEGQSQDNQQNKQNVQNNSQNQQNQDNYNNENQQNQNQGNQNSQSDDDQSNQNQKNQNNQNDDDQSMQISQDYLGDQQNSVSTDSDDDDFDQDGGDISDLDDNDDNDDNDNDNNQQIYSDSSSYDIDNDDLSEEFQQSEVRQFEEDISEESDDDEIQEEQLNQNLGNRDINDQNQADFFRMQPQQCQKIDQVNEFDKDKKILTDWIKQLNFWFTKLKENQENNQKQQEWPQLNKNSKKISPLDKKVINTQGTIKQLIQSSLSYINYNGCLNRLGLGLQVSPQYEDIQLIDIRNGNRQIEGLDLSKELGNSLDDKKENYKLGDFLKKKLKLNEDQDKSQNEQNQMKFKVQKEFQSKDMCLENLEKPQFDQQPEENQKIIIQSQQKMNNDVFKFSKNMRIGSKEKSFPKNSLLASKGDCASVKMNFVPLEIAGVINSSEINKILSNDLVYLSEPDLSDLFYSKYYESKLQTHYMDGAQTSKMGDELGRVGAISQNLQRPTFKHLGNIQKDENEFFYYKRGSYEIASDDKIEVNTKNKYELGIQLKVESEMRVKIGFLCYDEKDALLNSSRVFIDKSFQNGKEIYHKAVIVGFDKTKIQLNKDISHWKLHKPQFLGISNKPDNEASIMDESIGQIFSSNLFKVQKPSTILIEKESQTELQTFLTKHVKLNKTVIANMLVAKDDLNKITDDNYETFHIMIDYLNLKPKQNFEQTKIIITGESVDLPLKISNQNQGNFQRKFWPGTRYVRILLYTNWVGSEKFIPTAKTMFRKIYFKKIN